MSSLDGIPLFDATGVPTCGGAFLLRSKSYVNETVDCPNGWKTQVEAGCNYVVARKKGIVGDYAKSRDEAFHAAQQGLDLLSIIRKNDLSIRDAEVENIVWWHESVGQVVRTTNVATIYGGSGSPAIVGGKPLPVPKNHWHESLRYFRLSQVTDDLFDSYRNLYLALESLLDRIAPQKQNASGKPTEGEGKWLKRALSEAGKMVNLKPFVSADATDPVDNLYKYLYVGTRTKLFHAKRSRPSLLPHTAGEGKESVAESVKKLSTFFMKLVEVELGTRPMGGYLTEDAFDLWTEKLLNQVTLHVSSSHKVVASTIESIEEFEEQCIELETRHAPEFEKSFVRAFLGQASGDQISKLNRVAAVISLMDHGRPMISYKFEGELKLSGIARLECQMSLRHCNIQRPREHFSS